MTGQARPAACGLGALNILRVMLASSSVTALSSKRIRHYLKRIEAGLYLRGRCCVAWIAEHMFSGILSP